MSITVKNVTHVYSKGTPFEKKALDEVNLEIKQGEFIGLIGHTGSGKSTLIQHLNALLKPDSGTILINGEDIHSGKKSLKQIRQTVGLVFQYPEHQLFEMTILKDVAYGPSNIGLNKEEIEKRVVEALNIVGIDASLFEKSPFELSGGQKRRVAIAGVLAMKPEVLILDEPTAGLDPKGRDDILQEIKKLHDTMKITIILVSHSMEDIANYVDRIIVMDKGKVILEGDKYEVFKHVKKLEEIGLGVPAVTKISHLLEDKGFQFENTITTIEEAVEALVKKFGCTT